MNKHRMTQRLIDTFAPGESVREFRDVELRSSGRAGTGAKCRAGIPLFRDYVVNQRMTGHCHRWKPLTRRTVESRLRSRLLPAFGHLPFDRITPANIDVWFDRYSATAPGGANQALALLRQIMNHAVSSGLVAMNPARSTRMNPKSRLTRFLLAEEIVRLHKALDLCVAERLTCAGQADIIRLLLYTGSRKSEIKNLRWSEVEADTLRLADSKTGPRTVHMSADRARRHRTPEAGIGPFVFPSPSNSGKPFG